MGVTLASSIYCVREDKVLLLERTKPPFAGSWVAPGGKIDDGEAPFQAAHRELREETGLSADELILRGIISETSPRPDFRWLIFFYVSHQFTGDVLANSPEGKLAWWPISQVIELPIPEADRIFFPQVLNLASPIYQAHFSYDQNVRLLGYNVSERLVDIEPPAG